MNAKAISEKNQASGCGRVVLFLFGMVFAAFGVGFIWFAIVAPTLKSNAAKSWIETECRIISSVVKSHSDDDGTTYSPDIKYQFETDGQTFQGKRHSFSIMSGSSKWANGIVRNYRPGESHACFYDPNDPSDSVLTREMDWSVRGFFLPLIIPLIFLLIGVSISAVAILGWGRKSKNPPAISSRADTSLHNQLSFSETSKLNQFTSGVHPEDQLDASWSVPKKLKPENSKWILFLIVLGVAIFWNGIVSVFVFGLFTDDIGTWGRVGMGLFLTPFVLIGLVLLFAVIYMFMSLFNPGVEIAISTGAVPLGGEVDIAWEIEGNARRLRKLKVEIQGEQSATYQFGTSTSTDFEIFELIPVCEVTHQADIEFGSATVRIPDSTMHTFDGGNNKVSWTIVVHGEIPWWPDVNATYPFRVKPTPSQS